jgi:hypothetical protein
VAASLATATKFNGVPLVLVVAAVGAVRGPWLTRALRAGGSLAVGLLPSAYWLLSAREGRIGRPPDGLRSAITELGSSMSAMLASPSWPSLVRSALVLGTCVALVVTLSAALRNEHTRARLARLAPALCVAVLMILQLVFTRGFVDRNVQVNGRQMALVHLLIAMTVIGLAAITVQRRVLTQIWAGVLALAAVWAGAVPVGRLVVDPLPPARTDDVVTVVSSIPREQVVFTNAPDLVYQATGRSAHLVPCPTNFFSGLSRIEYEREVAELAELVRSGEGSIILFDVWLGRPGECGNIEAIRRQPSLQVDEENGSTVISAVN